MQAPKIGLLGGLCGAFGDVEVAASALRNAALKAAALHVSPYGKGEPRGELGDVEVVEFALRNAALKAAALRLNLTPTRGRCAEESSVPLELAFERAKCRIERGTKIAPQLQSLLLFGGAHQ